jgi:hypothetical protein
LPIRPPLLWGGNIVGVTSRPRLGAFLEQRMGRPTPCEKLLGAQPIAPGHLRHVGARLQALLHNAGLVVTRPLTPPPRARDQLNPPHIRHAVAVPIGIAFKRTLKPMVKMIAHGPALRHDPSPPEMWGRKPAHDLLASSASVFRVPRDDHAHLGRNLVQALGAILADDVQRAATARARLAVGLDHHLLMRQMIEAFAAAGPALARAPGFERRIGLLVLGLGLGERGLELLEGERQLIVGDALGLAAKMRAADLLDDRIQPRVASRKRVALGFAAERLMEMEVGALTGAAYGENARGIA